MKRTIILIAFAFLISCQSNLHRLKAVETVLWEKPDSALVLLEQMDSLQGGFSTHEKAYFGLLKSIALDKNYIDITTDSLIRPAVEYYDKQYNHYKRMLAHYYHGVVYENAHSYTSAILEYDKAEMEAEISGNNLYLGHIYEHKGFIFTETHNYVQAISCFETAISHFSLAKEGLLVDYTQYSLAVAYADANQYTQADSVVRTFARPHPNDELEQLLDLLEAMVFAGLKAPAADILNKYDSAGKAQYTLIDYPLHALAFERYNLPDSADFWFKEAYAHASNRTDSAAIDAIRARVEHGRKHYEAAYNLTDRALTVQDSLVMELLRQSLSNTQRDFYKSEYVFRDKAYKRLLIIFCLTGTVFFLILFSLGLTFLYATKKRNEALKESMAELAIQQEQLSKARKDNAALTGSIFRDKFMQLHSISADYFKADSSQHKEIVFANFKHVLKEYTDGPVFFEALENDLNRFCENVMAKLREQVPVIKGQNLKIIALLFAGQSYNTIKLILNAQSIEALKTAKSRYRKAIKESNAPDTNLFLEMLDKKYADKAQLPGR